MKNKTYAKRLISGEVLHNGAQIPKARFAQVLGLHPKLSHFTKILKRPTMIVGVLGLLVAVIPAPRASAALFDGATNQACQGVTLSGNGPINPATGKPANGAQPCDSASTKKIDNVLQLAIGAFSLIVGVGAVIMIIIGGLKYITSQGDSNGINSAKNTILYAIIGLVIVALAQLIVRFTLNRTNKTIGSLKDCTSQRVCEV